METVKLLYCWYWHEGWQPLLACLTIGLMLYILVDHWRMGRLVKRLNLIYLGIEQKIIDNYQHLDTKVTQVERRATQRFPDDAFTGDQDKTRIKRAQKKHRSDQGEPDAGTLEEEDDRIHHE